MAKSIEDLATMNAILQARVWELHQTATDLEYREARDSHIREQREEEKHKGSRVEGSRERNDREEEIPGNLPPPQTETEKAVQGMIARLEQRCNFLTTAIQRRQGKSFLN